MAILGNIRKRTTVLILIIGMALFAFVISGIFTSNNLGGVTRGTTMATVNGTPITYDEVQKKLEQLNNNPYMRGQSTVQKVNTIYEQEVRRSILREQYDDLGIRISGDQVIELVKSNPSYAQLPFFQDSEGNFSEAVFRETLQEWRDTDPAQYQRWLDDETNLIRSAEEQTYFSLLRAASTATDLEGEFDFRLAQDKVDIEYVRVPYSSIPDEDVVIGKEEIARYIKDHPEDYEQEDGRDIHFVFFEQNPSLEDENALRVEMEEWLTDRENEPGFRNTSDLADFLEEVGSETPLDSLYVPQSTLPAVAADSIVALEIGETYGPYRDGDFFKATRMMDKKPEGNVKSSHVLIAWVGAERAGEDVTRDKEAAKALADKVLVDANKEGASFANLARDFSDGPSAQRGGDLGFVQRGSGLVAPFEDYIFDNPEGTIGIVETEFGYHVINVVEKQDLFQVATLTKELRASEATIYDQFREVGALEVAVNDADATRFADIVQEKGYQLRPVNRINALDENLPGLGIQREIVRWAFEPGTEVGAIKKYEVDNGVAVVQVTKKHKKGLMEVEDASATVLPILRKERKAELILAKNKEKDYDAFASDNGVIKTTASALSAKSATIPGAGNEPYVVGRALALAGEPGTVTPMIKGETGIFMLKVTGFNEGIKLPSFRPSAMTLTSTRSNQANFKAYNALKGKADIKDNRADFF